MPEELQEHMTIGMRAKLLGEEPQQQPKKPAPQQEERAQAAPPPASSADAATASAAAAAAAADALKMKFTRAAATLASTVTAPGLHSAVQFVRSQKEQAGGQSDEPDAPQHVFTRVTRETREWAPARLLCKRLGVAVPHTDAAAPEGQDDEQQQKGTGSVDALAAFAPTQAAVAARQQPTGPPPPEDKLPQELLESSETPDMDLFKAIFDEPLPIEEPPKQEEQRSDETRDESVWEQRQEDMPRKAAQQEEGKVPEEEKVPEEPPAQPMLFPEPPPGFVYHHEAETQEKHEHKHSHSHKHNHHKHKHHHHKHHRK